MYSEYPPRNQTSEETTYIYQKTFLDGRVTKHPPVGKIITREVIRAFSYALQELARYRKKPVAICTDEEAVQILDNTFISIGGPAINEMTKWILEEKTNQFIKFSIPDAPTKEPWTIDIISNSEKQISFARNPGNDYGIVLKIRNPRFPEHFYFVCAGLGVWGTSGATWYLSENWQNLYKKFRGEEFGIVLEVNRGSDTSAIPVFPQNIHMTRQ